MTHCILSAFGGRFDVLYFCYIRIRHLTDKSKIIRIAVGLLRKMHAINKYKIRNIELTVLLIKLTQVNVI